MSDYGEKTRSKIKESLEKLVENGTEKNITVSRLLNITDIARSTFYVYYENMEDLFEDLALDYAKKIVGLIRNNHSSGRGAQSYRDAYELFIKFVYEHRNTYAMMLKNPKLEKLFLSSIQTYLYEQYLLDFPKRDSKLLQYSAYACTNYVYSIIKLWSEDGFDKTPEEMSFLLTDSIGIATDIFYSC